MLKKHGSTHFGCPTLDIGLYTQFRRGCRLFSKVISIQNFQLDIGSSLEDPSRNHIMM